MTNESLRKPLDVSEIDFRIQNINKGGYATILAYKDARVDMNRLDEVYGVGYWQRKHEIIGGNLFCSIGIYNREISQWVWVQDVGTESYTEKEKGQASDSFKRAGFNLGIGRELYDYPQIIVELKREEWEMHKDRSGKDKPRATFNLKLKQWRWNTCFDDDKLIYINAVDQNGHERFVWVSLDGLTKSIDAIRSGIDSGDLDAAKEAWLELNREEKTATWVAKSKGGPWSQEDKKILREFEK